MTLRFIPPSAVMQRWADMLGKLRPALDVAPVELFNNLMSGEWAAFDVNDGAGYIVGLIANPINGGPLTAWVKFAGGSLVGGPKARAGAIRLAMDQFEGIARNVGCGAVRVEAERWAPVLADYQIIGHIGRNHILQKWI